MNTEILGVVAQIVILLLLSYPLGKYIAKVYKGEKTVLDFMKPVERLMYRLSGINPEEEMDWKQFLRALLMVNLFWFVWGMVLLVSQGYLPLNPDGNIGPIHYRCYRYGGYGWYHESPRCQNYENDRKLLEIPCIELYSYSRASVAYRRYRTYNRRHSYGI